MKYIYLLIFFITTLLAYIGQLFMQNGTLLEVKMVPKEPYILNAKLYYASENHLFSETKSALPFVNKQGIYLFSIPKLKNIDYLRLDPSSRAGKAITLTHMSIVVRNWFKTTRYTLDISNLSKEVQVAFKEKSKSKLHFLTSGRDSQLHFKLGKLSGEKTHHYYFIELMIAILLGVGTTFLIWSASKEKRDSKFTMKLMLYLLFLSFTLFKVVYYKDAVKFGYPPDETMHLKYVQYTHNHHQIVPDFEKMPHYLSHPSLYYEMMNIVYDDTASVKENIQNFRTLSMLIFILTFMLILYLGYSAKLSILGDFVYLSIVTSIPMHSYLGASLTNDTLAMLGGIVFILGLKKLFEKNYHTSTYLILALGAFIAFFSKLTAALLVFFAVLYFAVHMLVTRQWISFKKRDLILVALFFVPILFYQISIMINYHALVPTYNVTHPEAYLKSGFYTPEQYRQHLSPMQWFERMVHYIQGGWFGIHSHHSIGKASWLGYAGLLFAHILALIALFFRCPEEKRSYCLIGKVTLLAILSVQVVQYFFSYKSHLNAGYMGGLQPRYLLPFMFAFAIMASLFVERFKQYFVFTLVIILMCLHALYSDFFYFLLNYH
jgi:hypothetical protein